MKIPLDDFESHISATILKRGLDYFHNSKVKDLKLKSTGSYHAEVEGSESYKVKLKIIANVIQGSVCSCPYDLGPICKHIAAVIFELQKDILDLQPKKKRAKRKVKEKKDPVVEILGVLSHEELKEYLLNTLASDRELSIHFQNTFSHLNPKAKSTSYYAKQIKKNLRSIAGRDKFIGWNKTGRVYHTIMPLIEQGGHLLEKGKHKMSMDINFAVLTELVSALDYSDDSSGDIGGLIDMATNKLYLIADEPLSEENRKYFIDFCVDKFKKKVFEGWDWHMQMMDMASSAASTKDEVQMLSKILSKTNFSEYNAERATEIKLLLLEKFGMKDEIYRYKFQHRANKNIRTQLIEEAISKKEFAQAIELAHEGQKQDKGTKPGLVKYWVEWELKIAQTKGDKNEIIRLARHQFLESWNPDQDYYTILKESIAANNWKTFINELINDLKSNQQHRFDGKLKKILISEERYAELFNIVKEDPHLNTLVEYEQYLVKDYRKELTGLYEQGVGKYLKENLGRKHYKSAVRYIRKIKKLSSIERANMIIDKLRETYPRRIALMEELDKL